MGDTVKTTISMSKKDIETLRKLAKEEQRDFSKQIVFMMNEYIKIKAKWEKLKNE